MNQPKDFFELAQQSPFTALCHIHDHIWKLAEPWKEVREPACAQLRIAIHAVIISDAIAKGKKKP